MLPNEIRQLRLSESPVAQGDHDLSYPALLISAASSGTSRRLVGDANQTPEHPPLPSRSATGLHVPPPGYTELLLISVDLVVAILKNMLLILFCAIYPPHEQAIKDHLKKLETEARTLVKGKNKVKYYSKLTVHCGESRLLQADRARDWESGLIWKKVGDKMPKAGKQLEKSSEIVAELRDNEYPEEHVFDEARWDAFGIEKLRMHHFVKTDTGYYQPMPGKVEYLVNGKEVARHFSDWEPHRIAKAESTYERGTPRQLIRLLSPFAHMRVRLSPNCLAAHWTPDCRRYSRCAPRLLPLAYRALCLSDQGGALCPPPLPSLHAVGQVLGTCHWQACLCMPPNVWLLLSPIGCGRPHKHVVDDLCVPLRGAERRRGTEGDAIRLRILFDRQAQHHRGSRSRLGHFSNACVPAFDRRLLEFILQLGPARRIPSASCTATTVSFFAAGARAIASTTNAPTVSPTATSARRLSFGSCQD
jgi:hypothetical protein